MHKHFLNAQQLFRCAKTFQMRNNFQQILSRHSKTSWLLMPTKDTVFLVHVNKYIFKTMSTNNILRQCSLCQFNLELIFDTSYIVSRLESIEGCLVLDQLALVLLRPLAVPVDVEAACALLVERLHVSTTQLLPLNVHLQMKS